MRIYLDACCLNRPFDDQRLDRNRLEAEAVVVILRRVEEGLLTWVGSAALMMELGRCPDSQRRKRVTELLSIASETVEVGSRELARMDALVADGLKPFDALHVACAESGRCDVFLTTDDRLLKKAATLHPIIPVANPLAWLDERTS